MDIDEFLGETPVETPEAEAVVPEVTEEPAGEEPPAEEAAAPTEPEKTGEEVSPPETTETMVPLAALTAERDKRQALERQQEENKPDFYEDPEGALKSQTETVDNSLIDMKVTMSIQLAKTVHSDFEKVVEDGTWEELTKNNPALYFQAIEQDNPGLFAYQQCQNHKLMQEIGDPATYKERIKTEIMAELKAETEKTASLTNLPETLGDLPSANGKVPTWSGPEPLGEIVG